MQYILQNEKYTGTLVLQKYYTVDYLTKKTARNQGQIPQYIVENNHPAIIPKEVFVQAQHEFVRRGMLYDTFHKAGETPKNQTMSGRVFCGLCGRPYYRRTEPKTVRWKCAMDNSKHICKNVRVKEKDLQDAIIEAINRLPEEKENLIRIEVRTHAGYIEPIERELKNTKDEQRMMELKLELATHSLRWLQAKSLIGWIEGVETVDQTDSCNDYDEFLAITQQHVRQGTISEWDETLVYRFVKMVIIEPKRIEVQFKAGVTIVADR